MLIGPLFLLCSVEFVGRFEESGGKLASVLTPVAYVAWSIWLLAVGIALLVGLTDVCTTALGWVGSCFAGCGVGIGWQ